MWVPEDYPLNNFEFKLIMLDRHVFKSILSLVNLERNILLQEELLGYQNLPHQRHAVGTGPSPTCQSNITHV